MEEIIKKYQRLSRNEKELWKIATDMLGKLEYDDFQEFSDKLTEYTNRTT